MFKSHVITGSQPGPHLLFIAGVHGDEWEPIATVRTLLSAIDPSRLRGKVTLVPILNESAFWRAQRVGEDGLDLARTCPGDAQGSPSQKLAHEFSTLLSTANYLVDLHTGGLAYYLMPLAGFINHEDAVVQEVQRDMARAFGLPLVWGTPYAPGRTLSVAHHLNIPAIYAEWGGGAPFNTEAVLGYIQGCINVLSVVGMYPPEEGFPAPTYWVEETKNVVPDLCGTSLSPRTGFWERAVQVGDRVQKGQVIGHLWDPTDLTGQPYTAEATGLVVCVRGISVVQQGESLARIVEVPA